MSVRNKFENYFVYLQNKRIDYGKGENVGGVSR
ncbi:hypothetical protein SAMN04487900_1272 [Prevotella communis]|uniref:Uncharacterized protein n=1 Tax=Prevotella communis TaxID=2913614 RepID=A0A1H0KM24_9BACT|nr:hypothetical protein SAMN04487900_1272 [Prevotella communis]